MAKKLLIANWKLNPLTEREAVRLAKAIDALGVVIAPPFPFLNVVGKIIKRATLGAQDVFYEKSGAYTGAVSPEMLKNLRIKYVIIGHSERRNYFGETDKVINKKVSAAIKAGLKVILCVGEPWAVRTKGLSAAKSFVRAQLTKDLKGLGRGIIARNLYIAYEPIWAIGTGKSDKPQETAEMARHIKNMAAVPVLYGGSVNAGNVASFLLYKEVGGALVGGASLRVNEFKKIIRIASDL